MDSRTFWQEEIRTFPHGCRAASLWVVRCAGRDVQGPLQVVQSWGMNRSSLPGDPASPPLGAVLRALQTRREELSFPGPDAALWVEPLGEGRQPRGCLALMFAAEEPWRDGVFLWGQNLAARVGPVLGQLDPVPAGTGLGDGPGQLLLFQPAVAAAGRSRPARPRKPAGIPLPRPLTVPGIPGCIGISQEMRRLGRMLSDVAASDANVLLHGESGTGKEIVAAAIHQCSARRKGPFVGQNCAALPETLFESELFGHRAGAFTGAAGDKKGLLASANGGTFFLDEIGDMPLALQIKLLRVMQERRIRRIGELTSQRVDIRFVAATHKDLPREIDEGRFRLDLYYRLKVVHLEIPALRHRPEDIAHLFAYFLRKFGRSIDGMAFSEGALAALQSWRWPGNVRELENEVQRFLALYPRRELIEQDHLSPEIRQARQRPPQAADLGTLRELDQAGALLEQYLIRKAIAAADGRKAAAARRLGLSRQGLYKKIQRYGMTDLIAAQEGGAGPRPDETC